MKSIQKLFAVAVAVAALSASAGEKERYLVTAPHTPESCLKALDEANAAKTLNKWEWGCLAGDHTGYLMVEADSDQAALAQVPASERAGAKVQKLNKFTAEQVKSFHKK